MYRLPPRYVLLLPTCNITRASLDIEYRGTTIELQKKWTQKNFWRMAPIPNLFLNVCCEIYLY